MTHLVTTTATVEIHRCGHPVLAGIAEGLAARVDPQPLNPTGALAALLAGRATYILNRGQLVYRDPERIRGGTIPGPILGQHACGNTPPPDHRETTAAPISHAETPTEGFPY